MPRRELGTFDLAVVVTDHDDGPDPVDQVIGGPTQPVTKGAVGKFPGAAAPVTTRGSLSNAAAFHTFSYGVGQAQVVGGCLGLGAVLALVYRTASRRRRYRGGSV